MRFFVLCLLVFLSTGASAPTPGWECVLDNSPSDGPLIAFKLSPDLNKTYKLTLDYSNFFDDDYNLTVEGISKCDFNAKTDAILKCVDGRGGLVFESRHTYQEITTVTQVFAGSSIQFSLYESKIKKGDLGTSVDGRAFITSSFNRGAVKYCGKRP